jgi:hypothetical protein
MLRQQSTPTVPVVGWGFIPGVPIKLIVWVSKVGHLKPPLQMSGQRAARRMGFRFGMRISNGGLAHRSWARAALGAARISPMMRAQFVALICLAAILQRLLPVFDTYLF